MGAEVEAPPPERLGELVKIRGSAEKEGLNIYSYTASYSLGRQVPHPHPDTDLPVRHAGVRGQLLQVALPGPELERGLQHRVGRRRSLLSVSDAQGSAHGPGGRDI